MLSASSLLARSTGQVAPAREVAVCSTGARHKGAKKFVKHRFVDILLLLKLSATWGVHDLWLRGCR